MKKSVALLFFNFFVLISICYSNSELKSTFQTYSYLKTIDRQVNYLIQKNPNRELDIRKGYATFNLTFGRSLGNIVQYFKSEISESEFQNLNYKIDSTFQKIKYMFKYSDEDVNNFINELVSRSKGNIPSPYLENILHYQYINNPESELIDDFYEIVDFNKFSQKLNATINIKIPKSWKSEAGRKNTVLLKSTSACGKGFQMIVIGNGKLENVTEKEKKEMFENKLQDIIPNDGKFINYTNISIASQKGGCVEYELSRKQLDFDIQLRSKAYCFIYKNNMIIITCSVSKLQTDSQNLKLEMEKFNKLFLLMINSIMII